MTDTTPGATLAAQDAPAAAPSSRMEVFTFGEPEPVLSGRDILDYIECWTNGKWYEPPVPWGGLARSFHANPHHASSIYFKRNVLLTTLKPHPLLPKSTFSAFALDYLIFGNAYLQRRTSRTGRIVGLEHPLAKFVRRDANLMDYWFTRGWRDEYPFPRGSVFQLKEPDVNQEIYGLPEYLSALQSAWLNESATLFRRRYYNNGSHAGFILYMTDPAADQKDVDGLRAAMKASKGPGNFRNLFFYAPNGKKDGMQLIPIGEVTAKDEFFNIKNVSRDDVLAAHRIPPQLLGIVPSNTGGFGAVLPAAQVFARNEIKPLQDRFREVNEWLGEDVIDFVDYEVPAVTEKSADAR